MSPLQELFQRYAALRIGDLSPPSALLPISLQIKVPLVERRYPSPER